MDIFCYFLNHILNDNPGIKMQILYFTFVNLLDFYFVILHHCYIKEHVPCIIIIITINDNNNKCVQLKKYCHMHLERQEDE